MFKNTIFVLFFLFSSLVNAQSDSSFLFIRLNVGYADISSSNGAASLGASASNISDWNIGLSVGIPVGKRLEAGLGFEYTKQNVENVSIISVPLYFDSMELTETNANLFIGKAYLVGHWRIFNRLYFNPMFSFGVGKAKGKQKIVTLANNLNAPQGEYHEYLSHWLREASFSYDFFAVSLAPSFSFFFNKHFALNIETGAFQFATTDWEWDNRQWLATIKPQYWQAGIILAF